MSEAFTPLTAPEAVAAAHRIYDRADRAPSLRRALTGVPDRELISIVILARQLDEIARAAATLGAALSDAGIEWGRDNAMLAFHLGELLTTAGYLPLPPTAQHEEPAHGQG